MGPLWQLFRSENACSLVHRSEIYREINVAIERGRQAILDSQASLNRFTRTMRFDCEPVSRSFIYEVHDVDTHFRLAAEAIKLECDSVAALANYR